MGSSSRKKSSKGAAAGGARREAGAAKTVYDDWVWWPNEPSRRSRAEEEFRANFPPPVKAEMLTRIGRLLDGDTRSMDVKDLGGGIKELRYRTGNNHYRILFAVFDKTCVGLTCFYKNQQRTEKVDLDRAKSRRDNY